MTDRIPDPHPDSPPDEDKRSDIERAVEDRNDADRGNLHDAPDTLGDPGMPDGVGGTGGVTKNQEQDAQ